VEHVNCIYHCISICATMYIIIGFAVLILLFFYILNLAVFGAMPKGELASRIQSLPNYQQGAIQNISPTPMLPADVTYWQMFTKMVKGNPNGTPKATLPHQIPDFTPTDSLKITWFGHSSYLIQVDGLNILVDPVFAERPSPFQFIGTKQFKGTNFIRPEDLPPATVVLITHDHYDHLDFVAISKLKDTTLHFITSLGVGAHLTKWGIAKDKITELSWGQHFSPSPNLSFTALPARHFSGRAFKRNQTLWSSFMLQTQNNRLYLGGDSGYDSHFKEIGEAYGPFDLAILECGQYNQMWPLIHMFPETTVQASIDLKAKKLFPVHWGKYKLALHDWQEPIERITIATKEQHVSLLTPMLGETFTLETEEPWKPWWRNL
jgi:L-ascorbate metabolism protein UlaG (beta-lactamase superfamily)